MVENWSGCRVKFLYIYRADEFMYKELNLFCEEDGIQRELNSLPSKTKWNWWMNIPTIVKMIKIMLQVRRLSNQFWIEAVAISVYLLNLSPTKPNELISLWKMTWKETICKSFTSLWLCCLCIDKFSTLSPNNSFLEFSLNETPPRKYKFLGDIYASCFKLYKLKKK